MHVWSYVRVLRAGVCIRWASRRMTSQLTPLTHGTKAPNPAFCPTWGARAQGRAVPTLETTDQAHGCEVPGEGGGFPGSLGRKYQATVVNSSLRCDQGRKGEQRGADSERWVIGRRGLEPGQSAGLSRVRQTGRQSG